MENFNIQTGIVWQGDAPEKWIEPNRRLYDCEFVFFSRGRCRVITEKETLVCSPGTVVIIPPGYEHCTIAETAATRWCIHFDWFGSCPAWQKGSARLAISEPDHLFVPEDAARIPAEETVALPLCRQFPQEQASVLLDLLRNFFAVSPEGLSGRLQRQGLFLQIMGCVLQTGRENTGTRNKHFVFFDAKSLLDSRFMEPDLEIRHIAAELNISPNHLNKVFRRHLGISPGNYLQNRRLLHAEELLRETRLTIREIAFESGYADPNYFSRHFKNKNNITPQQFRSSVRE